MHELEHVPQLLTVLSELSQPLLTFPSQSPQPAKQLMEHVPARHDGVPFTEEHTVPQLPQLVGLEETFASHPLVRASLSQLPQPLSQAIEHAPAEHAGVPWLVLHAAPHAPQCCGLVSRSVSQPLPGLPSQSPSVEGLHCEQPHVPAVHVGTPLGHVHAFPQMPQWATLVAWFVSQPLAGLPSQSP